MQEFQVTKSDPSMARIVDLTPRTIAKNQVLAKIDRFAFTANNITYAVAGDMLRYWNFFPVEQDAAHWGVIPVWGFADIVESNAPDLPIGERLFGYFPPSKQLVMNPTRVTDQHFIEGAEHRADLPPAYNMYRRVNANPNYDRKTDNERMLLEVLYITGFCLHDLLTRKQWYDAQQIIVISASSKTSIGLAYALDQDKSSPTTIGLTSARNLETVTSLGIYNESYAYDELDSVKANKATVIIDMSGNQDLLSRLHKHLGDNMCRTINVGITHWNKPKAVQGIYKDRCEQFFAPSHIHTLIGEWGFSKYQTKTAEFFKLAAQRSQAWLNVQEVQGVSGLMDAYPKVCTGTLAANTGLIVVM